MNPPIGLPPVPSEGISEAEKQLEKLSRAQQRLLPSVAPNVPGYRIEFQYHPAYFATGDYYDFFLRQDGRYATFVGDGSGHGPAAAMLMATMRTILKTHPQIHDTPGKTLKLIHQILRDLIPSDMFMTGVYLLFEAEDQISWASGGQHPPVRIDPSGTVMMPDKDQVDVPMGIHLDWEGDYPTVRWQVQPGERLLLFTDGLYEAQSQNGEKFGRCRLQESLRESKEIPLKDAINGLVRSAEKHMEGADFDDDFTVIGIERC